MTKSSLGLLAGILLGLAYVWEGFDALLIAAMFGVIGLVVGRVLQGDIDLDQYIGGRR